MLDDYGNELDTSLTDAADKVAADNKFKADTELANQSNEWLKSVGANGDYGSDTGTGSAGTSYDFNPSALSGLDPSKVSEYLKGNMGLSALLGGAGVAALGLGNPKTKSSIYQGGIPNLVATRNMITAPPTDRRPGAGGVNYGGDVTYSLAPAGQKPYSLTRGDSAFIDKPTGTGNVLKGTGGNDPQTMASKINYNLPQGWASFTPQQKIDWFNTNKITVDQLHAAGVPQSDIDYMLANGYGSSANKPTTTTPVTTGLPALPADIGSYTAQQKADLYNSLIGQKFTDAQIRQAAGPQSDEDWSYLQNLAKAPAAPTQSAGLTSALNQGLTEEKYINNIKDWLNSNADSSDQEVYDQMKQYGIGASDVARAKGIDVSEINKKLKALGVEGYAEGGMAKGRYLQGETDGMADEIPARIGHDQPAALSHGEFVVPADVVSHLGNGNSDAGAKKLYQMMDRIRMARTGNKEQGKQINPDKFMPGGLAKAYADGGNVAHFVTGGTTTLPANVTGTQAGLSNWAGDYTTDLMAQGRALANMPFQQYMGPLTAGASTLQNKVSQGLQGVNFPGILGQSFSSAGAPPAYNPSTMQSNLPGGIASEGGELPGAPGSGVQDSGQPGMPQAMTPGIQAPQSNMGGISQPSGIASSYMNPYLRNVLDPQLEELRRQSQVNLQPNLAKLTAAGGFGGGRQAIMESEANRNLLQEQNKTVGQGYANAYDKAMQQFNTEQGQAKDLVGMMSGTGATDRAIEAEGIAADKAQFEEARANPFKMVQFQQSLLSGMPINAMDYTMQDPSTLTKIAQGVNTVDEMLKVLYGVQPAKKVAGT